MYNASLATPPFSGTWTIVNHGFVQVVQCTAQPRQDEHRKTGSCLTRPSNFSFHFNTFVFLNLNFSFIKTRREKSANAESTLIWRRQRSVYTTHIQTEDKDKRTKTKRLQERFVILLHNDDEAEWQSELHDTLFLKSAKFGKSRQGLLYFTNAIYIQ